MVSAMVAALLLIPVAYLLGTFPTAQMVGRAHGVDVTQAGSGNPGASNVYRLVGRGPAAIVFVGDILKGAVPTLAGVLLWDHAGGYALGAAAVVGHIYPATRRFKGGRGVATAAGMAAVLYPLVTLGLVVVFFVISSLTHRASVASVTVAVALPLLAWVTGEDGWEVAALGALAMLVFARHSANLRRLVHGEELRLDLEVRPAPPPGSDASDGPPGERRGAA